MSFEFTKGKSGISLKKALEKKNLLGKKIRFWMSQIKTIPLSSEMILKMK